MEQETLIALGLLPWPALSRPKSTLTEKLEKKTPEAELKRVKNDVEIKCKEKIKELVEQYHAKADPLRRTFEAKLDKMRSSGVSCTSTRNSYLREYNQGLAAAGATGISVEEEAAMLDEIGAR